VYSIVLSVVLVTLIWAWLRMRVHRNIAVHNVIAFVAYFAIGSCLLAPYEGHAGTLITVLFWEFRDLTVAGCLVASYVWYRTRASESERLDIQRSRTTFIVACVLVASMCCEDLYTIVFMPIPAHGTWLYDFAWHLTERNLSENFLMMWCALRLVLSARQEMSVFGRHPASSKDLPSTPEQEKAKAVELKIPLFCEKFALSDREAEVVTLALNGKTTQQIADALVISTGTVKAHLHRIYVKCGVSNRKELIATFWRM
jgi:DNA-binding CsgD family transcriptional regulator